MNHKTPFRDKISAFISRFANATEKVNEGLIPKIADELIGGGDIAFKADIVSVLHDLFAQGSLDLPPSAKTASDFKPLFKTRAADLLATILTAAGHPELALASNAALKIIRSRIDLCGLDKNATPVSGLPIQKNSNGNDVILYFVEEVNNKSNLPLVDGGNVAALAALDNGFSNWSRKLKLEISRVGTQEKANLLVTGADLGKHTTVLARTEIGPPRGRQLRMVYNLSKTFTTPEFEANASHELGHALGIFHEDVDMKDKTLVMHGTLLGIARPKLADIEAAKSRGWTAKG